MFVYKKNTGKSSLSLFEFVAELLKDAQATPNYKVHFSWGQRQVERKRGGFLGCSPIVALVNKLFEHRKKLAHKFPEVEK